MIREGLAERSVETSNEHEEAESPSAQQRAKKDWGLLVTNRLSFRGFTVKDV
jgi:hypothetical protein